MLFWGKDIVFAPRATGTKRVRTSAKRMPADSNLILKLGFKLTSESFSKLAAGVSRIVKFFSVR
jgi:hypothetical protein